MTEPKQLRANVPAEAAQIIDQLVGGLRMDGLTGQQVSALLQSIATVHAALNPPQEPEK